MSHLSYSRKFFMYFFCEKLGVFSLPKIKIYTKAPSEM